MLDNVYVFTQSSIKIDKNIKVYFDPFKIDKNFHDADYIFITHDHYDHFDPDSIFKVRKDNTKIIVPRLLKENVNDLGFDDDNMILVVPNESYEIDSLRFNTVSSYNVDKPFHPKENGWCGYVVIINGVTYYIAGDTDGLIENESIDCDVAFVPIGGVYTMDYREASIFINKLKPKIVVPTHYGSIVGRITDGESFSKLVDNDVKCVRLLEEN